MPSCFIRIRLLLFESLLLFSIRIHNNFSKIITQINDVCSNLNKFWIYKR